MPVDLTLGTHLRLLRLSPTTHRACAAPTWLSGMLPAGTHAWAAARAALLLAAGPLSLAGGLLPSAAA